MANSNRNLSDSRRSEHTCVCVLRHYLEVVSFFIRPHPARMSYQVLKLTEDDGAEASKSMMEPGDLGLAVINKLLEDQAFLPALDAENTSDFEVPSVDLLEACVCYTLVTLVQSSVATRLVRDCIYQSTEGCESGKETAVGSSYEDTTPVEGPVLNYDSIDEDDYSGEDNPGDEDDSVDEDYSGDAADVGDVEGRGSMDDEGARDSSDESHDLESEPRPVGGGVSWQHGYFKHCYL